jgi:hypothetical protein
MFGVPLPFVSARQADGGHGGAPPKVSQFETWGFVSATEERRGAPFTRPSGAPWGGLVGAAVPQHCPTRRAGALV